MFGFSTVGHALQMLRWLMSWILQTFRTCKNNLSRVWYVTLCPQSTNVLHTPICCMHQFDQKSGFLLLIPTSQAIIQVGLLTLWLYLMCVSVGLTSWMTSEFHSYVSLEVSYIFQCLNLFTLFILVGFNHISMVIIRQYNGLGWRFPEISTLEIK